MQDPWDAAVLHTLIMYHCIFFIFGGVVAFYQF